MLPLIAKSFRFLLVDIPQMPLELVRMLAEDGGWRNGKSRTGKRLSLRKIAQELAAIGLLNERGLEYNPNTIKRMVEG